MTGPAVGLQTVFGTAEESTFGTAVTVDRFHEILNEGLERKNIVIQSQGLRGGARNLRRGSRRVLSGRYAEGPVNMEVATTGMGRWLKHLLGGTPTIAQQGGTPAWLQTHTMGDLTGKSLTVQKQLRDAAQNVIAPFTLHGTKVLAGEFSISVQQILQLALTLNAQDIETATGAASASYSNPTLFNFSQGVIKVGGVSVASVLDAKVKVTNVLKTDRYYIGSGGLHAEPTDNDFPTVDGTLSAEFLDTATFYDRFAADSAAALVLEFTAANISGIYNQLLRITVPEIHFIGETPKVPGAQVVVQNIPYEGAYDGTNVGCKIEYQSTDTSI